MKRQRRGFTLIEAMISFALFTLVIGQIGSITSAARTAMNRLRGPRTLEVAIARTRQVLVADCAAFAIPGFLGPGDPIVDVVASDGAEATSSIIFYAAEWQPVGFQEMRRIKYTIEDHALVRVSGPAVRSNAAVLAAERKLVLMPNVKKVQFLLSVDGVTFVPAGSSGLAKALPVGLRIDLTPEDDVPRSWSQLFSGALPVVSQS